MSGPAGASPEPWAGLDQDWPAPARPRPVVVIGAGSIVRDAHLPAYRAVGLPVVGIYDRDAPKAAALAAEWSVPALASLDEAATVPDAVFDLAIPPQAHIGVLERLPAGSAALLQKPMGRTLAEADAILALARERRIVGAVNFQLRFAPMMRVLAPLAAAGAFGPLTDIEVHVNLLTPWSHFPFVADAERIELSLHSIHYLDAIRALAGEPLGVMARSLRYPGSGLSATRTTAILDYGEDLRCALSVNHHHRFGPDFQAASLRLEGLAGAAVMRFGGLLDYPTGLPDALHLNLGDGWRRVPLAGDWFPRAFRGPMSNLQRVLSGEDPALASPLDDAWKTMRLVEALQTSSDLKTYESLQ